MKPALLGAALLLGVCAPVASARIAQGDPDIAILPAAAIAEMLAPCSREAPAPGKGNWTPGIGEIKKLEAELPDALAQAKIREPGAIRGAPQGWKRQYVGIIRNGRRYIYGNFIPKGEVEPSMTNWRREPVRICDGGPAFFGVEYDVEKARVTHLAFNGAI